LPLIILLLGKFDQSLGTKDTVSSVTSKNSIALPGNINILTF
jgi:hypothetical protein